MFLFLWLFCFSGFVFCAWPVVFWVLCFVFVVVQVVFCNLRLEICVYFFSYFFWCVFCVWCFVLCIFLYYVLCFVFVCVGIGLGDLGCPWNLRHERSWFVSLSPSVSSISSWNACATKTHSLLTLLYSSFASTMAKMNLQLL